MTPEPGYRIIIVGERIPPNAKVWSKGLGPWIPVHSTWVGWTYGIGYFPVEVRL